MTEADTAGLEKLRAEIDRIDGELHRLLRERAAVVQRVGLAKRTAGGDMTAFVRPGREARLLRDLAARHDGALPAAAVIRIWREIVSAACTMQQPLRVALYAPERSIAHWDRVRNQFGVLTPIQLCGSAQRVLQEAGSALGVIGVLPWPEHEEEQPWWPNLATEDSGGLKIVGALPFFESATGRFEEQRLMIVASYPPEDSGDDTSYLIARTDPDLSRARLGEALKAAELSGGVMATRTGPDMIWQLLEVEGFVTADDPRLESLARAAGDGLMDIRVAGSAARPLALDPAE